MLIKDSEPIKSNSDHHREYGDVMHLEEADDTNLGYFVLPEVFLTEICKSFAPNAVAELLLK
ncbi:hypothetical protein [uncultured Massilia sp.]|uniref:hypothetical protein n=1 Tax=uncultured Massilia sp. TaxID=169973 RepID=UPI0025E670C1|nr:hypothetical protein [uncultured Massilia sp.]